MKPGWAILGGAVVVGLLWVGAPRVLRRLDFFALRRVELAGARYLRVEQVTAALALPPDASVFDPIDGFDTLVAALPGVRRASVSRRLPGTLRVEITEAVPVALAMHEGMLRLVDADGDVLPFDPTDAPADLPVIPADAAVTRLMARLRDADPVLYTAVGAAARVPGGVVLHADGRRYMFRGDVTPQEIRAMRAVAQDLARKGRGYRELDGRFRGRVLVRGGGA